GGDAVCAVSSSPPRDLFAGARSAVVIGFGGYMEPLARAGQIEELHVRDLEYEARRAEMEEAIAEDRRRFPAQVFTIGDGRDTAEQLREADVVAITGSALCNGTLEGLLEQAAGRAWIVVQGQSAAIYPRALFERGARLVVTTLKPPELARLAA